MVGDAPGVWGCGSRVTSAWVARVTFQREQHPSRAHGGHVDLPDELDEEEEDVLQGGDLQLQRSGGRTWHCTF